MKLVSGRHDPDSGLMSMFLNFGSEPIVIYRHDCSSGYDRSTGKYERSFVKIDTCGIPKPQARTGDTSDGVETSSGTMELITREPVYNSDQRDNSSADIVFVRGYYWKVEDVIPYCGYNKVIMNLMPEDECKGIRGLLGI